MELPIKKLKEDFFNNEIKCVLIKRNDILCIIGLLNTNEKYYTSYEVNRIYIERQYTRFNKTYPRTERISSNSQFGIDGSSTFPTLEMAEEYFEVLNKKLIDKHLTK